MKIISFKEATEISERIKEQKKLRNRERDRIRKKNPNYVPKKTWEKTKGELIKANLRENVLYEYKDLEVIYTKLGGNWPSVGPILSQMVADDILVRVEKAKYKLA